MPALHLLLLAFDASRLARRRALIALDALFGCSRLEEAPPSSMPPHTPATSREQNPDPEAPSSPLSRRAHRQAFTALRSSPLPPRKRQAKQPLRIRMNLTETQVDKITAAFTDKMNNSPTKAARRRVDVTPTKHATEPRQSPRTCCKVNSSLTSSGDDESFMALAACADSVSRHPGDSSPANLAERRQQQVPAPIQVQDGRTPHRVLVQAAPDRASPLSSVGQSRRGAAEDDAMSPYGPKMQAAWLSPGSIQSCSVEENVNGAVEDMYQAWVQMDNSSEIPAPLARVRSLAQRPRRSKSTSDGLRRPDGCFPPSPSPHAPLQTSHRLSEAHELQSPPFSPLALHFRGQDFPTPRKGEKTLIGRNGWLERTGGVPDMDKKSSSRRAGILENIKKIAKDMTAEFHSSNRRSQPSTKDAAASHVQISLDAREQSLLYCELEFHLTTALNDYMTVELDKGHLVPDNLKKISDWWASQGRPRVVGFRYDLETQLQLVSLHVGEFNFYGRRQSSSVEIAGLLDGMKTNARQMRVRTFCQPDSVVAKQLVDAQSLFNLINVARPHQVALAEVAQFFKVIVERERDQHEQRNGGVRQTHIPQPGQPQ